MSFALEHGVNSKGYCHLVVAAMAVVMFGAMCRYDDISHLRWRSIKFDTGYRCFHIEFEKRKNDQYRQGNRVSVATAPDGLVCPFRLMRRMMMFTKGDGDNFIFRGFNGRCVITSPERTFPGLSFISYAQFSKYLALWFGASLGLSPKEFSTVYGSQLGRPIPGSHEEDPSFVEGVPPGSFAWQSSTQDL